MDYSKPGYSKPYRLNPTAHEKVWGSTQLEPLFPNSSHKTGEFWFVEENSPVLIKFLFTTENLSVQVHPNDEQARQLEPATRGKTEMWHIIKAEPGAKLAMGLKEDLSPDQLRQAATDGSIMNLLRWLPAVPGETWFIPAGTIHAIGAGITLAEIQQNSDVTYRIFDYGRPRELHLERGIAVADVASRPEPAGDMVVCPYFTTKILTVQGKQIIPAGLIVVTNGQGSLDGQSIQAGEVWHLPTDITLFSPSIHFLSVIYSLQSQHHDPYNHQSGK
jgi:mannose-6-phosphate isomerase